MQKEKKSLEDNIEEYFYELRVENNFLKHTHNTQTVQTNSTTLVLSVFKKVLKCS